MAPQVNRGRRSQLNCKPPPRPPEDDQPTRNISMSGELESDKFLFLTNFYF